MSAPALRRPARVWPVLRDHLALWSRSYVHFGCILGVATWIGGMVGETSKDDMSSSHILYFLPVMGLSALRDPVEAALPLERTRYGLVRAAGDTVGAAVAMAVALGLYAMLYGITRLLYPEGDQMQYPGWFLLANLAWGITHCLLGSAVVLGTGRLLASCLCYIVTPILLRLPPMVSGSSDWYLQLDLEGLKEVPPPGPPEVLTGMLLPLGLACAAVYAAAHFQGRFPSTLAAPASDRAAAPFRRGVARDPARTLVRDGQPRRPASPLMVARRHLVLLRHVTWWWVLGLLLLPVLGMLMETRGWIVSGAASRAVFGTIVLLWSTYVALIERGDLGRWNDTLPVGMVKRRVLHTAAGGVWLLLWLLLEAIGFVLGSVGAGTLASPADIPVWLWLGVPCSALALYLIITSLVVTDLGWIILLLGFVSLRGIGFVTGVHLAPERVFAPLYPGSESLEWSLPVGIVGLLLSAGMAAGAIALGVRSDRRGTYPIRERLRRLARTGKAA